MARGLCACLPPPPPPPLPLLAPDDDDDDDARGDEGVGELLEGDDRRAP